MSSSTVLPHLLSQSLSPASHALACLPQTVSLLSLHAPFANQASPLPAPVVSFVKAIDAYVLGKDVEGRLVGWTIAKMIVEQGGADILETWGRSWVVGLMPLVGKSLATPLQGPLINLLATIFQTSPSLPPFHRETTVPYLQKFALGLVSWAGKGESVSTILPLLATLIALHPPSLRPLQPTLLNLALTNLTIPAYHASSAKIYSVLHLLPGKTASPQAYLADLNAALASASDSLSAVVGKVFEEEGIDGQVDTQGGKGGIKWKGWEGKEGELKRDRDGLRRMGRGVERLRGLVGVVCGMLRVKTERPVPVPIGSVLALGLRLFRLTSDGQTVDHVDPAELALAQSLLPELYMLGCAIVGQLVLSVKQNLLPHQTQISSYLIFLLEQSTGQSTLHLTLLKTLTLLTTHLPASPAPSSASLLSRSLKLCLSNLSPLLSDRPAPTASSTATASRSQGKGKKRSAPDSLLTLESTTPPLTPLQVAVVQASLGLMDEGGVMESAALPNSLRTLAVRVLVGLQMSLPTRRGQGVEEVARKVEAVLVKGLVGGGGSGAGGTIGGEAGWVVGGLQKSSRLSPSLLSLLLHPLLPSLPRPLPPASSLMFYKPEGKDERLARQELGLDTEESLLTASLHSSTLTAGATDEAEEDRMEVETDLLPAAVVPAAAPKTVLSGGMFDLPARAPEPIPAPAPAAIEVVEQVVTAPVATMEEVATPAVASVVEPIAAAVPAALPAAVSAVASTITAGAKSASKLWEDINKPAAQLQEEEDSDGEIPEIDMGGDSSDEEEDDE